MTRPPRPLVLGFVALPLILLATALLDSWWADSQATALQVSASLHELLQSFVLELIAIVFVGTMLGYSFAHLLLWRRLQDCGMLCALACAAVTAELMYVLFRTRILDSKVELLGSLPLPAPLPALLPLTIVTAACGVLVLGVASFRKPSSS